MKQRPILFSGPMVRAILAGNKTQTRRVVKPQPTIDDCGNFCWNGWNYGQSMDCVPHTQAITQSIRPKGRIGWCPYGQLSDRLWVRETWGLHDQGFDTAEESQFVVYRADADRPTPDRWRPSIHMPRAYCRILLEITDVRVERLQAISEADAAAEGVIRDSEPCDHLRVSCQAAGCLGPTHRASFAELWMQINGPASWDANPWVWAITFRRVTP